MADVHVDALRSSVDRIRRLSSVMDEEDLNRRAYPSEWTVADVLSHLGSGAVIMKRRLEDVLSGGDTPEDFAPAVWDTWNAKGPVDKRDDALAADAELLGRIDAVAPDQRRSFTAAMGPLTMDFERFVAMRLNEHAFHTWDVEVVGDPAATIPEQVAALVVDNLELIARFTAKPTGETTTVTVATTDPERAFVVDLAPESVTFGPARSAEAPDLTLPAEAFARLVYGRLDPQHTPPGEHGEVLAVLRRVFPGP
jgi:uncharacterized protein (TIGR03083 family)